MDSSRNEYHSTYPSMEVVDARITQASEIIKWSAFRGYQIYKRYLGKRGPCCAERDVVGEMKCKCRRIDAEKDGDDEDCI
jgi:hypothetical protein